jgi:hypothetical protein
VSIEKDRFSIEAQAVMFLGLEKPQYIRKERPLVR